MEATQCLVSQRGAGSDRMSRSELACLWPHIPTIPGLMTSVSKENVCEAKNFNSSSDSLLELSGSGLAGDHGSTVGFLVLR